MPLTDSNASYSFWPEPDELLVTPHTRGDDPSVSLHTRGSDAYGRSVSICFRKEHLPALRNLVEAVASL